MILDRHYIQDHSHKLLNVYPSMCLHTLPKLPLLPQFRILFFQRVKWPISSHYCPSKVKRSRFLSATVFLNYLVGNVLFPAKLSIFNLSMYNCTYSKTFVSFAYFLTSLKLWNYFAISWEVWHWQGWTCWWKINMVFSWRGLEEIANTMRNCFRNSARPWEKQKAGMEGAKRKGGGGKTICYLIF